ncbi:hypothetical protein [Kineosporia sp. NBRC 101731]|uniref:hypothetical protein n=1 Tax=Kineosporia sp. NBRC 101731 TaxID=3032199 RepID=UPI0024A5DB61|nr:hypothetical protein [Kineosporia sp. NBRC 101731]GLY30058.1 hypothetical protein Kisp02_34230 [Kineosporia sp. NBRC 101731]
MTPARGAIRLARSAMFSLTAVSLAVAAHAAGGERVSLPVAVLCVPAVMLVVNLLAARRRGAVSLVLGLGVTQIVLHVALMAAIMSDGCRMAGRHLSSHVTGYGAASLTTCDSAMAGHQASDMFAMSPRMFTAHTVAVLLLALLLARGEAVVWALTGNLSHRLALPRVVTPPPAVRPLPVLLREALLPLADVPRRSVRRRGPPARSLVF